MCREGTVTSRTPLPCRCVNVCVSVWRGVLRGICVDCSEVYLNLHHPFPPRIPPLPSLPVPNVASAIPTPFRARAKGPRRRVTYYIRTCTQTDRHTDTQTYRHTDIQTHRQIPMVSFSTPGETRLVSTLTLISPLH